MTDYFSFLKTANPAYVNFRVKRSTATEQSYCYFATTARSGLLLFSFLALQDCWLDINFGKKKKVSIKRRKPAKPVYASRSAIRIRCRLSLVGLMLERGAPYP
jgi:hypothetical protein